MSNDGAIDAIRAKHARLAAEARTHTDVLLRAIDDGSRWDGAWHALCDWYYGELLPHITATEHPLYSRVVEPGPTKLLAAAMLADHRYLVARVADFAFATRLAEAVAAAVAVRAILELHFDNESDLLLPTLHHNGVDLVSTQQGMTEAKENDMSDASSDCGCGCAHDSPTATEKTGSGTGQGGALDVRTLPHGDRHDIIFDRLERLGSGESLVIVNDHDPKPLRYQMEALWPEHFVWSYLETGPEQWQVEITNAG